MFQTKVVQKIKPHILCPITIFLINLFFILFYFFENSAVNEIMWKNTAEPGRPRMTTLRMRILCWILKATNTIRTCNIYWFSTATISIWTHRIVKLRIHCVSCYIR